MSLSRSALFAALVLAACSSGERVAAPEPQPNLAAAETLTLDGATMSSARTLAENAAAAPSLTVLVAALEAAGLDQTLDGAGPYTVFAPTDAAFAALPPGAVESLLRAESRGALTTLLTRHIAPSLTRSSDLRAGQLVLTLGGETLPVRTTNGQLRIGGAALTVVNVPSSNGVLHVIDAVLAPTRQ